MSAYHVSTKYYSQIQILDYQICCSLLVCAVLWVMCAFYEALHIHSGKKKSLERKKTTKQNNFFSCLWHISIYTSLIFWLKKTDLQYESVTAKHAQVLDASTKSMRSLNDNQLFYLMLDMDHKVLLGALWLPVQWLKS